MRSNEKVKALVRLRMSQKGIHQAKMARDLNIDQSRISRFFNKKRTEDYGTLTITQYQLMRIADYLDIELSLNIKFKDTHE